MGVDTRLPSAGASQGRATDVLIGIAALVGLLVIVAGVPVGLWLLIGTPWAPEVHSALASDNSSVNDLIILAAALGWLLWAYFCVCVVVEAVAEGRGGRIAPQLLGGGAGLQTLAHRLVSGIALFRGTTASTVAATHALTMGPEALPEADRRRELEAGSGGATPAEPTTGRRAEPEQQPAAPEGIVAYYDVAPPDGRHYETLWDIAEMYLGSGLRYKEIYALNKDVVQPDGATMSRTDLIRRGWVLRLPADANGPGLRFVDHSQESLDEVDTPPPADAPAAVSPPADASDTVWTPAYGAAGGLVSAGLLAGLRRYRASATVGALADLRLDPPDNGLPPEAALRNEADPDGAAMLDRCLRSWTATGSPGVAPIAQCSVSSAGVAVSFHGMPNTAPPHGWQATRDGHVWTIGRDASMTFSDAAIAPAPGLVTFGGREDGSTLLMDLDSFRGLVSIGGDPHRARALAMSFALDAATHRWADRRQVTMVGFADDITAVSEESIRVVDDLQRAIHAAERVATEQRQACARLGVPGVYEARFTRPDPLLWQHHLLICSGVPSPDSLAALHDLAADTRASIAVVVIGDVPTAAGRLVASSDGKLTSQPLGLDVRAQGIDVDAYRGIVDVYRRNRRDDVDPDGPPRIGTPVDITAVDPAVLDASTSQPVEVGLLGPISVSGPGAIDPHDAELMTEIAVYAAVQPHGVHPDAIGTAIWPRGVDSATRDAALARVSAWLGEERFRQVDGLWVLDGPGVRVDWDVFRAYLDHSERMPQESIHALAAAMELVRGEAWAELPAGRYAWLAYDPIQVTMPALVVRTARRLAAAHAEQGAAGAARDALLAGLRMAPASEQLWRDALGLANRYAAQRDVKQIADQMYAAIERHGSPGGARADTIALVDQLLPGYRHTVA